jgi:PKHD-type hydroxylase
MPYPVRQHVRQLNQFCVANDAFTPEEVDQIIDLEDLQKFQRGGVGNGGGQGKVNKKARDSEVMWIQHDPNSDWLFQKFSHLVSMVNHDHFMYNIEGYENFQYTRYRKGEFYDWHIDAGDLSTEYERKISATIILSDPKEYEGGEFQCVIGGRVDEPMTVKPKKGDAIFFASWMPHRVTPVTKGVRKSLVCWVMGKRTW